jgi:hypothetical protein
MEVQFEENKRWKDKNDYLHQPSRKKSFLLREGNGMVGWPARRDIILKIS